MKNAASGGRMNLLLENVITTPKSRDFASVAPKTRYMNGHRKLSGDREVS